MTASLQLENFTILSSLGKGGMGQVYLARDEMLDRLVAVKVLSSDLTLDATFLERFFREAKAAASLEHSNIVGIHSISTTDGQPYIVMQYVRGCSLGQLLQERGRLDVPTTNYLVLQMAEALQAAHTKGIIHRDIKPDNIMITEDNQIKIMDFGLARSYEGQDKITQTGYYLGTPQYSSPEQCETTDIDNRSDLYSLGVVLYEMLSGQVPHEAETPLQLFRKIVEEEPRDITQFNADVPPSLVAVLNKLLAKRREDRYQSASELIDDLKRCHHEAPTQPLMSPNAETVKLENLANTPQDQVIEEAVTRASDGGRAPDKKKSSHLWTKIGVGVACILAIVVLDLVFFKNFITQDPSPQPIKNHPDSPDQPDKPGDPQKVKTVKVGKDVLGICDFINRSPNRDGNYLCIAITDMMITELGNLPGMQTLTRDGLEEHLAPVDKKQGQVKEMARVKGVFPEIGYLLVGRFFKVKKNIRVSYRLYHTGREVSIKNGSATGTEDQLFDLVADLVQQVKGVLVKDKPTLVATASKKPTPSAMAPVEGSSLSSNVGEDKTLKRIELNRQRLAMVLNDNKTSRRQFLREKLKERKEERRRANSRVNDKGDGTSENRKSKSKTKNENSSWYKKQNDTEAGRAEKAGNSQGGATPPPEKDVPQQDPKTGSSKEPGQGEIGGDGGPKPSGNRPNRSQKQDEDQKNTKNPKTTSGKADKNTNDDKRDAGKPKPQQEKPKADVQTGDEKVSRQVAKSRIIRQLYKAQYLAESNQSRARVIVKLKLALRLIKIYSLEKDPAVQRVLDKLLDKLQEKQKK